MSHIVVNGSQVEINDVNVITFENSTVRRFVNQKRTGSVTELILHETVTRSWPDTVRVLEPKSKQNPNGRGLGVHFIVESDGIVYQHGDLATDLLWHANQHNGPSVGIEIVNPYYPKFMPKSGPWSQILDAPWADGGKYVIPTQEQLESVVLLTKWLCEESGLDIPNKWIGSRGDDFMISSFDSAKACNPGIYAHHYFGHMDGCFPALYSWLRIVKNFSADDARDKSMKLCYGAKIKVNVADSELNC